MITIQKLIDDLALMEKALLDKGLVQPNASAEFNYFGSSHRIKVYYKTSPSGDLKSISENGGFFGLPSFTGENDYQQCVDSVFEMIRSLKSANDLKNEEFNRRVADLIKFGEELDKTVEVTMLRKVMKSLSTNIIEHKE